MARGKPIGPTQADQALRLVAEGKTLSEIATIVGLSYGGLHKALTETWPDEYAEAKQRRDDVIRNKIWDMGVHGSFTRDKEGEEILDGATTRWALDHLIKWHLPEARETQRLEVTGTVAVQHEARLTLAHMLAVAERIPGLSRSARAELPAAGEVLAELGEGQP